MRALLLGLLPLTIACGGPSAGEIVQQRLTVTLSATSSQPQLAAPEESQGGLAVTRAFVAASAMTLVPCSDDVASVVLGARGYDLLVDPAEEVTTGVSDWCAIELDLDPVNEASAEGVPDGATLYVEATDAQGAEYVFASERSQALRFETTGGGAFVGASLVLGFDLALWLTGLPIAEPDMTEAETELLDSQLRSAVALYADGNENEQLDEDEATPIAIAAPTR